jgi:hypothetical protein
VSLRLELWVEGAMDARSARADLPEAEAAAIEGGALVPLVRKLLASAEGMTPELFDELLPEESVRASLLRSRLRERIHLPGGKRKANLSVKAQKLIAAFDSSMTGRDDTMVIAIWDRDGEAGPLELRDEVLGYLRSRGTTGAAVGVCIEEVEAWLLADAGAFRRCFGRGPASGLPGAP